MNHVISAIPPDKRDRVINSALKEFAQYGFEKASTNKIVKEANISKGLLFHYFKNKEDLFDTLKSFSLEVVVRAVEDTIDWENDDFFERIKQIVSGKIRLTHQYPYLYDFILIQYQGKSQQEMVQESSRVAPELLEKIYRHNIDFSKFRDELDIVKVMSIINWTFEKFSFECIEKMRGDEPLNFDKVEEELQDYIRILKAAFYKEQDRGGAKG